MKKIILDVDTGSDDAVAIMAAVKSAKLDLLAVLATHGNQPLDSTLDNTLRVMSFLESDVPVYKGATYPICKDLYPGREASAANIDKPILIIDGKEVALHQKNIGLPDPTVKEQAVNAVFYLIDTLLKSDEKITIIPVGPCTNLATAMRLEPKIIEKIEKIIVMGGGDAMGNRTAAAEFNFYGDPEAAKIVVNSGLPVILITLNATHSALFSKEDSKRLHNTGSKEGAFAATLIDHRIDFETLSMGKPSPGTAVHDAIAVLYAIDESVVTEIERVDCDVDIGGGASDGMLLPDRRGFGKPVNENVYIASKVDKAKVLTMLTELFS